ncbi:uncharacterized protein LOC135847962 [Planococcus citri]|uniref:uncharacterized protein LOC135847962 n=1 Tax=Planococcus citri TaxID=170843 RepID=UPI0031F8B482
MENFVDVGFFQNNDCFLVKHLYILYSLCGAYCYEKYVRFKFRCFIIILLCYAYFRCTAPQIKVIILHAQLQHVFQASGQLIYINFVLAMLCTLYWKRKEFHRLFDLLKEKRDNLVVTFDSENQEQDHYLKETNISKIHFTVYFTLIAIYLVVYFGKLFDILIREGGKTSLQIDPQFDFFIPFFCDDCNTWSSYFLAFNFSYICGAVSGTIFVAILFLLHVLLIHLENRAGVLQNDIRYHSHSMMAKLEEYSRDEDDEMKKKRPNTLKLTSIKQQRDEHIEEYMVKVVQWIKMHQHLMRLIKQYQKCAESVSGLVTGNSLFSIIFFGYFVISFVMDQDDLAPLYLPYGMIHFTILLICCNIGSSLNDLSDIVSNAVYSMPWYYFPVKDQKTILNFLALSQPTQHLNVFGFLSLNLEMFPHILNDVYGHMQTLRLLVNRHRN